MSQFAPLRHNGSVSRRIAVFLLASSGFTVVCWVTFIRNLARDHGHPTAFYVVHAVLIVLNLAMAAGLAVVGRRMWQQTGNRLPAGPAGA